MWTERLIIFHVDYYNLASSSAMPERKKECLTEAFPLSITRLLQRDEKYESEVVLYLNVSYRNKIQDMFFEREI